MRTTMTAAALALLVGCTPKQSTMIPYAPETDTAEVTQSDAVQRAAIALGADGLGWLTLVNSALVSTPWVEIVMPPGGTDRSPADAFEATFRVLVNVESNGGFTVGIACAPEEKCGKLRSRRAVQVQRDVVNAITNPPLPGNDRGASVQRDADDAPTAAPGDDGGE